MNIYHPYTIFPLGDSALTIDFGNIIHPEINKKVMQLFRQLQKSSIPHIDLIPAYSSLTLYYDPAGFYQYRKEDKTVFETIAGLIEALTENANEIREEDGDLIEIPVCYAPPYALDMDEVTGKNNIPAEEVIALHSSKIYRVYMIGFLPGFAYMGEVDEKISVPRKPEPRIAVPAGAVGIAGTQTGIYPLPSPGGWQIIGQTPVSIFNKEEASPVLLKPGDKIKFYSISEDEFTHYQGGHT